MRSAEDNLLKSRNLYKKRILVFTKLMAPKGFSYRAASMPIPQG